MLDFLQKLIRSRASADAAGTAPMATPTGEGVELKNRADELLAGGQPVEAAKFYRDASTANPRNVSAFLGLAQALLAQNRLLEARAALDSALIIDPEHTDTNFALGVLAQRQDNLQQAIYRFREVLRLRPGMEAACTALADALAASGDGSEAEQSLRNGLEYSPQSAAILVRLGKLLGARKMLLEAIDWLEKAVAADSGNPKVLVALGTACDDAGQHERAIALMRRALELHPDDTGTLYEMGICFWSRACMGEAADCFRAVLAIDPDHLRSHLNLAQVSLAMGDYATGWPEFEWRFKVQLAAPVRPHKVFSQPLWLGGHSIAGKTILLHCEQGYGDTLQFCRYAAEVAALGARVVLQVQRGLGELLAGMDGVFAVVEEDHPLPGFDVHCPLMSLPLALGHHRTGYVPSHFRYLSADPARVAQWQQRLKVLAPPSMPRIGVVWSGYAHHVRDNRRSIALAEFLKLLPAGVHAVCLQPEVRDSDLPAMQADARVTFLGSELQSFADTAALIESLDLVVTVDTSVAHAAGALGKPVWLLVSHIADWRWLRDRSDSPWYPNTTVFRQPVPGDWSQPLAQVRQALRKRYQSEIPMPHVGVARDLVNCAALKKQGNALLGEGRLEEAGACYAEAMAADPMDASVFVNLGYVLSEQQRLMEAAALLEHALKLDPDQLDAHFMLGTMAQKESEPAQAVEHFRQTLRIDPGFELAYSELGYELVRQEDMQAAEEVLLEGIRRFPSSAALFCNLGNLYSTQTLPLKAIGAYEQALALEPDNAQTMSNLGAACEAAGDFPRAIALMRRALELNPQDADTLAHLGISLGNQGLFDDAINCFKAALEVDPEHYVSHLNLGFNCLLLGNYDRGFTEYEWRFRSKKEADIRKYKVFAQPVWRGEFSLTGKTILLSCEQGFGDTINFCRYAAEVSALGARVVLEVQAGLKGLMKTLDGIAQVVEEHEVLPPFDCYCPLLSLPLALGHHRKGLVLANTPYLKADPARKAVWQERLGALSGGRAPRVGIVWSGHAIHKRDHQRSIALADFLQALPGDLPAVCLQPVVRDADMPVLKANPRITFLGSELRNFTDTAAIIDSLDLVVTVDTSVAHVAGALGKPVWILVTNTPDWRWLLGRDDSPWYPSARLFRQPVPDDWSQPLAQVRLALGQRYQPQSA